MATAKNDKEWSRAVRKAVHEYRQETDERGKAKKIRYLNVLAAKLVETAADGDMTAMKEVGDRLDGKPNQSMDVNQKVTLVDILRDWNGAETAEPVVEESEGLRDRGVEGHA